MSANSNLISNLREKYHQKHQYEMIVKNTHINIFNLVVDLVIYKNKSVAPKSKIKRHHSEPTAQSNYFVPTVCM